MTSIDIQVSSSKVSVEGQAYSLYVEEGGISVLQTGHASLLHLVQLITPKRFAPEASNLVS